MPNSALKSQIHKNKIGQIKAKFNNNIMKQAIYDDNLAFKKSKKNLFDLK